MVIIFCLFTSLIKNNTDDQQEGKNEQLIQDSFKKKRLCTYYYVPATIEDNEIDMALKTKEEKVH